MKSNRPKSAYELHMEKLREQVDKKISALEREQIDAKERAKTETLTKFFTEEPVTPQKESYEWKTVGSNPYTMTREEYEQINNIYAGRYKSAKVHTDPKTGVKSIISDEDDGIIYGSGGLRQQINPSNRGTWTSGGTIERAEGEPARIYGGTFGIDPSKPVGYRPQENQFYDDAFTLYREDDDLGYAEDEFGTPALPATNNDEKKSTVNDFRLDVTSEPVILGCGTTDNKVIYIPIVLIRRQNDGEEYLCAFMNNTYQIMRTKNFVRKFQYVESIVGYGTGRGPYHLFYTKNGVDVTKRNVIPLGTCFQTFVRNGTKTLIVNGEPWDNRIIATHAFKDEIRELIMAYDLAKDGIIIPGTEILYKKYGKEYKGSLLENDCDGNYGFSKVLSASTGEIHIVKNKDIKICI